VHQFEIWVFVVLSLLCFVTSIISGLFAQIRTIDAFVDKAWRDRKDVAAFVTSWIGFAVGMLALCVYGVRNFIQ
jgi:hypothetical protein